MKYVLVIIGANGNLTWSRLAKPKVPKKLLAAGETAFVFKAVDMKARTLVNSGG